MGCTSSVRTTTQVLSSDDVMSQQQQQSLRLQCRLGFHTLPMGNGLPMLAAEAGKFVDAHVAQGITIEQAIEGVGKAMPLAMNAQELMLRRQIATTVLITMGR
jgi:hypothetical protein